METQRGNEYEIRNFSCFPFSNYYFSHKTKTNFFHMYIKRSISIGYHLSLIKFIDSLPNFQLNGHQTVLICCSYNHHQIKWQITNSNKLFTKQITCLNETIITERRALSQGFIRRPFFLFDNVYKYAKKMGLSNFFWKSLLLKNVKWNFFARQKFGM